MINTVRTWVLTRSYTATLPAPQQNAERSILASATGLSVDNN